MRPLAAALFFVTAAVAATRADDRPLTALPYSPSLDVASMDRAADPCIDFYQYSCGGWMKNNPVPADQARWSVYAKASVDNLRFLWGTLEEAARPLPGRTAAQQKIGDFFAACMDTAAIDKKGIAPVAAELAAIARLDRADALAALLGAQEPSLHTSIFFELTSEQDYGDASRVIPVLSAGGLGLPDRDFYFDAGAKADETRRRYVAHVGKMLALGGEPAATATAHAQKIMALETALAKASLTRVEKRDPHQLDHKLDGKALRALTPRFDWGAYFKAAGVPDYAIVNVAEPKFLQALDGIVAKIDLDTLRAYLRWHLLHDRAAALSKPFVDEDFEFFSRRLRGVQSPPPRWKSCVRNVDRLLGEALGQYFVQKTFSPELKSRTLTMTVAIEEAMQREIESLPWMEASTKANALEKLRAIVNKVGYPDKWRDYSTVQITRDDFLGDGERALAFEWRREQAKIGKPLDRGEWGMTPPTVNAYYDPQMNDINFPAGVLQPPLFDGKLDDAPNFGDTGSTIGHELTHGFDDQGRQFDARGNLRDWWTPRDAKEFERRAQCVVDQYAQYTIVDDKKINSKLTEGEDVADLGGTQLAYFAWKKMTEHARLHPIDGLSPDQRFFVGMAQWACETSRPEDLRVNALINEHSPGRYRVNGVVANMPEFAAAFQCKAGQPMVHAPVCKVW
jgi:putative endopeptidase